ncbi:MAG TPA: helix-turn-helix domain-containing protein [Actinomycetes bacterium]|nr:helix-turn-helix domain-containing protein [Actinomycetes bacterium]
MEHTQHHPQRPPQHPLRRHGDGPPGGAFAVPALTGREPGYLRTFEVAELLHVSPKTITRWAKCGKLPFFMTLGGHRRYPADEIRALAAHLRVRPAAESA